jgi:hypothetical protein
LKTRAPGSSACQKLVREAAHPVGGFALAVRHRLGEIDVDLAIVRRGLQRDAGAALEDDLRGLLRTRHVR